jgi:hypothetical protein
LGRDGRGSQWCEAELRFKAIPATKKRDKKLTGVFPRTAAPARRSRFENEYSTLSVMLIRECHIEHWELAD